MLIEPVSARPIAAHEETALAEAAEQDAASGGPAAEDGAPAEGGGATAYPSSADGAAGEKAKPPELSQLCTLSIVSSIQLRGVS